MRKRYSRNKYGNRKVTRNGIKFDSMAEAAYYPLAVAYAVEHDLELRLQEPFILQEAFRVAGKRKQAIKYIPDFTFWDGNRLAKVVDVKGPQTEGFKIKAKWFCYKYQTELILAKYDYRTGLFTETAF